jgi:uncharacterized membrane protein YgcG
MTMNNKFTHAPEDKLEEALALLAAGIPLAEVLAEAGNDASWLRPLLQVATEVGELRAALPLPPPEASLQRMLNYSQELSKAARPQARAEAPGWLSALSQFLLGGWLPRLAAGAVTALVVVALLGGTLTVLAQRSLPGQSLYPLKRLGEAFQLSLTQDPASRTRLQENFNQRRQQEAQLLLQQNVAATVRFEGEIEAQTAESLTLAGLTVQLTSQTKISGNLAVGAKVSLEAQTQPPDSLVALSVNVVEPAPPTPLPTSTSTSTPTPLPTATATPGQSQANDVIRLPSPTPTATPLPPPPTATSTPEVVLPTATPVPPSGGDNANSNNTVNDNSGADDNANSNETGNSNDDNTNGNDNSGGDDHSGNDNSSDDGDDNSGSGSNNSGSGGGDSGSDSDNSGGSASGGDDKGGGSND